MNRTMKAVRYARYGDPKVLTYDDVPMPEAGPGQVLVRIHAAGVNPIDTKLRSGALERFVPLVLPTGVGQELAGEVTALGVGVDDLQVGDAVYAMLTSLSAGAYAQYAAVDRAAVSRKPLTLDFEAAAAVPVGALTAWQSIVDLGGLKAGERLFVHAAGGNVGGWAVRIGHAMGAVVTAAASARSRAPVLASGATVFIDYDAGPFETAAAGFDVVLDLLGGEMGTRSLALVKPGGIVVSAIELPNGGRPLERGARAAKVSAAPSGVQLARIASMIDAKHWRPQIGRVLPLSEAVQAHTLAQSGAMKGKIVLKVD